MSDIIKAAMSDVERELQPIEVRDHLGGIQAEWSFPNGYGASVVHCAFSYGVELAVLHNGHLTYTTPITDDVVGHIASPAELLDLLRGIRALPAKEV